MLDDINGDGRMDIVAGNSGINYVVFLDRRLPGTLGDFQTHRGLVESRVVTNLTEPIHSAILTVMADIPIQTKIDFYLSNNDGQNWYQVYPGKSFLFPTTGSELRWKAELHSLSPAITPVLKSVTITGNSAPTDILLSRTSIEENLQIGTEIGTFEALDMDGGSHTYELIEGFGSDDNDAFTIQENKLLSNSVFDFESKQSYTIRVRATDEGSGEFEKQFTIGISDANDPPTDILLSDNTIGENLPPGTTIGILAVTDIDSGDLHAFSLPEDEADNELFAIDGTLLLANTTFDFESAPNRFSIRIRVSDGGNASFEKNFEVLVTNNVNDTVEVKLQLSSTEFSFGKRLTVVTDISSVASGSLNAGTVFQFSGPDNFKEDRSIFSSEGGVASVTYAPSIAGEWQVVVNWAGNNDFDPGQSEPFMFMVGKSDTILELFFLGVTQILGQGRTIPGRLVLNNGNPGNLDLSGLEISATIGKRDKSQTFTAITDAKGNFDLVISADFFDDEGQWDVRAAFAGNVNLKPSNIGDQEAILVRKTHGYAILVQGAIANGEGADEHGNTLDFVRRSFEDAGFSSGIENPDIRIISRSTPNSKDALRETIEDWAKDKMLAAPAPLYLVLINHGEFGKFHMHPDELTPAELDGMLDNLQKELANADNSLASEQAIISILGMCFSGSFISELSGNIPELLGGTSVLAENNRIVISAAAPDEFSIRGTGEDDERQGEFFVYSLFRELNKGLSLTESFRNSRELVRHLSADRNLAINVNAVDPSFPGEKGQHPLLDDNGDGLGSSIVLSSSGDGDLASTVFLTQPTNAIPSLQFDRVSPSVFLPPGEDIPQRLVWAEIDEKPEEIRRIWMEVKKVADDGGVDETSTMQHDLDLFVEPMDLYNNGDFVGYEWPRDVTDPNPFRLFLDPGAYQVFFYAESTDTRVELSDPRETIVYRASGNHTPSEFNLLLPQDGGIVDYNPDTPSSSGIFSWEKSQSPNDNIEYIYRVWADEARTTLVFESEPLIMTRVFLPPESVTDDVTYWWDVVAVDVEGNFTTSRQLYQFTVKKPNAFPGTVFGKLSDEISSELIMTGEVFISGLNKIVTVDAGYYIDTLVAGTYTLTGKSDGYLDARVEGVKVTAKPPVRLDFELTKVNATHHTLSVTSDPKGIPISGSVAELTDFTSMFAAQSNVTLTGPEIFTGADGMYQFVQWVLDEDDQEGGATTVSFQLIQDMTARASYRPVVGVVLHRGWNLVSVPVMLTDDSV